MSEIMWAAERGRPGVPIVPRSRIPAPKAKQPVRARPLPCIVMPVPAPRPDKITASAFSITRAVAKKHDVTIPQMMGDARHKPVVIARQEAWWRIWRELGHSYPRIAKAFGKDHSTIIHGVRRHEKRMQEAAEG